MPCRGSVPPAIFRGMRKALSPDLGASSPWERTDGLPVKAWDWESGALDAFPGYIRNVLCGTTYFCAHVSSSSFPLTCRFFQTFHLAARMFFFSFTECFSQTRKPPGTLSPVPGPDAHSCPGFFPLLALPINLSLPLAELLPFDVSPRYCLWPKLLLALLSERRYRFCRWRCTWRHGRSGCRGQSRQRARRAVGSGQG